MLKFGLSETQKAILESIFEKYPRIKKVIIFGSRAKNTHKEFSDIDLCLLGKITDTVLSKINQELIDSDLIYKVDLIAFEEITNNKLKENIENDGVVFWQASV